MSDSISLVRLHVTYKAVKVTIQTRLQARYLQSCGCCGSLNTTIKRMFHLVPFTFAGDFVGSWKESTVMTGKLVPTAMVIVRHHQQVVHVSA